MGYGNGAAVSEPVAVMSSEIFMTGFVSSWAVFAPLERRLRHDAALDDVDAM